MKGGAGRGREIEKEGAKGPLGRYQIVLNDAVLQVKYRVSQAHNHTEMLNVEKRAFFRSAWIPREASSEHSSSSVS